MNYTPPVFNVQIGTVSFIVKRWSLGLKWMWKNKYYGKSVGTVQGS